MSFKGERAGVNVKYQIFLLVTHSHTFFWKLDTDLAE